MQTAITQYIPYAMKNQSHEKKKKKNINSD